MKHDLTTPKGRKAAAAHLRTLTPSENWRGRVQVGYMSIIDTTESLKLAADILERGRRRASAHRNTVEQTPVEEMDAVRVYGTPEAALVAIERQLAAQSADMDPAAVRRAESGANRLRHHIEAEAELARLEADDDALRARIAKGTVPGNIDIETPVGTEVHLIHEHRNYLGTVESCKMGAHPILGSKYPSVLYTVRVTHILETRDKRYAYHPMKPKTFTKILGISIAILQTAAA